MAAGGSIKQTYWLLAVSQEEMPPTTAVVISALNTVFNSLNSFLCIYSLTSVARGESFHEDGFSSLPLTIGGTMYLTGIFLEAFSEIQRTHFKQDPNNKGKPFTGGLFSLAGHINYGGITLWRAGYAMAAAGWPWAAAVGGFFFYDFASRGVPVLDAYCQEMVCWRSVRCMTSFN